MPANFELALRALAASCCAASEGAADELALRPAAAARPKANEHAIYAEMYVLTTFYRICNASKRH